MTTAIRKWYEQNEWRNPYQRSEVPALAMTVLSVTTAAVGTVLKAKGKPIRALGIGSGLVAAPLYALTYSRMHNDADDTLKYEPAILASAIIAATNYHHAMSSAKTVPTAIVITAVAAGMYHSQCWRYKRAYLGKNWKAYLGI